MVNPQKENGHTDIANQIVDQFCKYRLSGEEWQVLWVILRKTYGWHKKSDKISLSQFSEITGIRRQSCLRALNKLISKGVIKKESTRLNKESSFIATYSFVKVYTLWGVDSKKSLGLQIESKSGLQIESRGDSKKSHTKENYTKEKKDSRSQLSNEDFIESLKNNPAYKHINIYNELCKMDAWLLTRPGRIKTKLFVVNWLNKIDTPLATEPVKKRYGQSAQDIVAQYKKDA